MAFQDPSSNLPLYYEFKDDNITEQPATIKGTYLPEYKNIFDLYITDSTTEPSQLSSKTGDDANSEFALGEAAFYQNGTWAWSDLQKAGMEADSVGMMPIYIGAKGEENQGLATGSENYWCINSKASKANQKATADFLKWVITSDKAKKRCLRRWASPPRSRPSPASNPTTRWSLTPWTTKSPVPPQCLGTSP